MSCHTPPSVSSTTVEAPESTAGNLSVGHETNPSVYGPVALDPILPLNPDEATSMLACWVYEVRDVTLAERLQQITVAQGGSGGGPK